MNKPHIEREMAIKLWPHRDCGNEGMYVPYKLEDGTFNGHFYSWEEIEAAVKQDA